MNDSEFKKQISKVTDILTKNDRTDLREKLMRAFHSFAHLSGSQYKQIASLIGRKTKLSKDDSDEGYQRNLDNVLLLDDLLHLLRTKRASSADAPAVQNPGSLIGTTERACPEKKENGATLHKHEQLTINNYYKYYTTNPNKGRWYHFFTVDGKQKELPAEYQNSKGDHLKSQILDAFKKQLEGARHLNDLENIIRNLKNTPQYTVLKTGQGLFTRLFGIETSSIAAFRGMEAEKIRLIRASLTQQ